MTPLDFIVLVSRNSRLSAIVAGLPLGAGEDLAEAAGGGLDHRHRVGDQERGDARAEDGHQFVRRGVKDHVHLAAAHQVAAEHQAEEQHDADDLEHDEREPRGFQLASSPLMLNPRYRTVGTNPRPYSAGRRRRKQGLPPRANPL
jgi:hypothetical protein